MPAVQAFNEYLDNLSYQSELVFPGLDSLQQGQVCDKNPEVIRD